jgi:hypothetical protein
MIKNYVVHDQNGMIVRTGSAPEGMISIQAGTGEYAIEAAGDDLTQYVVGGAVTDKPAMPVSIDKTTVSADGIDLATISGIPVGALCRVASIAEAVVNDGTIELTFDNPGDYEITIIAFPYLDYTVTINAT